MGHTIELKRLTRCASAVAIAAILAGGCSSAPSVEINSPLLGKIGLLGAAAAISFPQRQNLCDEF